MSDKNDTDFAAIMPQVAEIVFSELRIDKNKKMSSTREWRFGTHGSIAVDLDKGVWADYEDGTGGGVLDLLRAFKGLSEPESVGWLVERGFMKPRESKANDAPPKPQGKFAGFMDDWPIATYKYFDDRGDFAYEVLKFPKTAQTRFLQRRPHPSGGMVWAITEGDYGQTRSGGDWFKAKEGKKYEKVERLPAVTRWLYHRAEVLKAIKEGKPIFVPEGEKDVETLRDWGLVATTNAGGAKNWTANLNEDLVGANVVLLPDNDAAGKQRMLLLGGALRGIAKSVRVLDLAVHWPDMAEKNDVTDWKEKAAGTREQFEVFAKRAPIWKPEAPKSMFGGFAFSDLSRTSPPPDYLIDGWLTERGRSIIGGPSGSGKSFLAIDMAMKIATGQDFFQYQTKRGGVIYQAGEGGQSIKKRFQAYKKHFEVDDDQDVPLVILPAKVNLFSRDGDTKNLINEINLWRITMSEPLAIVFIDTLSTATSGADENSGKDMSEVLDNIALIESECRVHVCLVHHMNKDGNKLRGHTSIHANVDQVLLVNHSEDTGLRDLKLVKQKDDEAGLKIPFDLVGVEVGMNERTQRPLTSCVVVSVSEKERIKRENDRLGYAPSPSERKVLDQIFKAIGAYGKVIGPTEEPREALGKMAVSWKMYVQSVWDATPEAQEGGREAFSNKVGKEFGRWKVDLIRYNVIGADKASIWWKGKPIRSFPHTFPNKSTFEPQESLGLDEVMSRDDGEIPL